MNPFSIRNILFLIVLYVSACTNDKPVEKAKPSWSNQGAMRVETNEFKIALLQLDSINYFKLKGTETPAADVNTVITDPIRVQKELKGIVDFENYPETSDMYVASIQFKNGGVYSSLYEAPYFIAYYPEEGVLLGEGGHSSDVIFQLETGLEVNAIGNPAFTFSNKPKSLRLGSIYNGQGSEFFIEKKVNQHFEKVIPLSDILSEKENLVFETIAEAIWIDDSTLIFKSHDAYNLKSGQSTTIYHLISIERYTKNQNFQSTYVAKDPQSFLMADQRIVQTLKTDLNNDKKQDIIYVTQQTYSQFISKDENGNAIDKNRRGMSIALNKGDSYELIVNNPTCFYSEHEDGGTYYAPELSVEVENQDLRIQFSHGRYGYWFYTFNYEKGNIVLNAFESHEHHGAISRVIEHLNFKTKQKTRAENTKINEMMEDENLPAVYDKTTTPLYFDRKIKLAVISSFEELELENYYKEGN